MENPTLTQLAETLKNSESAVETKVASKTYTKTEPKVPFKNKHSLFDNKWANRVPEHIKNLVYIIRNNTEIRRFTAIGILNYLSQKGEIKGNKRYVEFLWNKFRVKVDGIIREYAYTEPFFLNCFVASFASFSASAQKTINEFCKKEMSIGLNKAIDQEEVNDIIESNSTHKNNKDIEIDAQEFEEVE